MENGKTDSITPSTYFELNADTIHKILYCDEGFGYTIYTKGPPLQTESAPPLTSILGKNNSVVCIYFLKGTSINVSVMEADLGVRKHITIDEMLANHDLLKSFAMSFMNAYTTKKEYDLSDPQSIPDLYEYLHTVCDNHKTTKMINLDADEISDTESLPK